MEATCFSEPSADLQQTTAHYIPKDRILPREKILELNEDPVRTNIIIITTTTTTTSNYKT
jgi:hypothetical protein